MMSALRIPAPILATVLILGAAACTHRPLAEATAPIVDCPADDMSIRDVHSSLNGPQWWTASCGDQTWFCSTLRQLGEPMCSVAGPEGVPAPALDPDAEPIDTPRRAPARSKSP